MYRILRFGAVAIVAAVLLAVPVYISRAGISTNTVSVIVEVRDDPAEVYAAKAKQGGNSLSNDHIQTYRNSLAASQNQFLDALKSNGTNFQLQTVSVKDASGAVAGSVPLR